MYPKPKKYLGQNFLIDKNIQNKIIAACQISPQDTILEIGAGKGELTRLIAAKTDKIFALEIDASLCAVLKSNLADFPSVFVIHQDILRFNISRYFSKTCKIKAIGNLPYYITTPIILHLLKFRDKIKSIFITVQKEFAQRMTAKPGSRLWSSFSCFLQYYTEPKILFVIKRTCFSPQPKVDSVFLRLDIKQDLPLDEKKAKRLFRIIRASFQQRRKTLRNSLSGVISQENLENYFHKFNIDKNIRPDNMSLEDFINLALMSR